MVKWQGPLPTSHFPVCTPRFPRKKVSFRSPSRDDRLLAGSRSLNGSIQVFPRADRAEFALPGRGWKTKGVQKQNPVKQDKMTK